MLVFPTPNSPMTRTLNKYSLHSNTEPPAMMCDSDADTTSGNFGQLLRSRSSPCKRSVAQPFKASRGPEGALGISLVVLLHQVVQRLSATRFSGGMGFCGEVAGDVVKALRTFLSGLAMIMYIFGVNMHPSATVTLRLTEKDVVMIL
ncbi:hypothetical protein EYF80_024077 [Liparis tanakae]|uniref:Uncharacterized protein n=1 Tax=Liparis tanakae TaxID=230148 RepID=A0A4Z2HL19_9TELE|nr:hypothetical protein EYF80_024077 [Liparis tanakae]